MRLILFFLIAISTLQPAMAETTKATAYVSEPKLNREVKLTRKAFELATQQVQETPLNDAQVAFRIRLPKAWQKLQTASIPDGDEENAVVGELSRYLGPAQLDLRSSFRVQAFQFDYILTAKNWFLNYLATNSYALQGLDESGDRRVQAHYVMVDNGVQYVVRAVAQITGSKILLAEYIVPIQFWAEERDVAIRAMASFILTSPGNDPIEDIKSYSFPGIASFSFPKSWLLIAPKPVPGLRMTATLANLTGGRFKEVNNVNFDPDLVQLEGRIDATVAEKSAETTLQSEALALKENLTGKGLVLENLIEPVTGWTFNKALTSSRIEIYKLNNRQNRLIEYEEWVGLFEDAGHIYTISMLTLGRNENFYAWARNREAYKIVVSNITPGSP